MSIDRILKLLREYVGVIMVLGVFISTALVMIFISRTYGGLTFVIGVPLALILALSYEDKFLGNTDAQRLRS